MAGVRLNINPSDRRRNKFTQPAPPAAASGDGRGATRLRRPPLQGSRRYWYRSYCDPLFSDPVPDPMENDSDIRRVRPQLWASFQAAFMEYLIICTKQTKSEGFTMRTDLINVHGPS